MSHTYAFAPKTVLRHLDPQFTRQYFALRGLLKDLPALAQCDPGVKDKLDLDALTVAIQELLAEQRTKVEQDLQDVYELADDEGRRLIYEEAKHRGEDLTALLTEIAGVYDLSMWTLINRDELFDDLLRFHTADGLNKRFWRRRYIGRGLQADTSESGRNDLSKALTDYLVREEGRGTHCHVECLQRSSGPLFVAFPEDFGTKIFEYEGDELITRPIRPATDLLFQVDCEKGTLDVFCHGTKAKVKDLQELFGRVILGVALPADGGPAIMYDLNLLKDETFRFAIDGAFGLQDLELKWVQVRDKDGGRGITIEVGGPPGRGLTFAAQKYWSVKPGEQTDKYPFAQMSIVKARLQAHYRPLGKQRRGRTKTFTVSTNGCLLDHEGRDGALRNVLARSGLERPMPDHLAA